MPQDRFYCRFDARDEENLCSYGRIMDNRNHRWIPPICERRAAFSSHPPTPISIDIFPLFSHFGIVIFKGAVKQGEKELQSRLENLKMCVHTPSNDNLGDRHVNLVYERDSGRADTRTLDEVEGQITFLSYPVHIMQRGVATYRARPAWHSSILSLSVGRCRRSGPLQLHLRPLSPPIPSPLPSHGCTFQTTPVLGLRRRLKFPFQVSPIP